MMKDVANAFRDKTQIGRLAPDEKVEGNVEELTPKVR